MTAFAPAALDWLADETDIAARDLVITPMRGANSSAVYKVCDGAARCFVLRVFDDAEWLAREPDLAAHEVAALARAGRCQIASPKVIAFEINNIGFGSPVVLMSHLPGNVELQPRDLQNWLAQLAGALARIHAHKAHNFDWHYRDWHYRDWVDAATLEVPIWATQSQLWQRAIELWRAGPPSEKPVFLHRDFHPCNVLWQNGKISGVVDWVNACWGPRGVDVAHCRTNMATLFGVEAADNFRDAYLAIAGGAHHPYWDVASILDFSLPQPEFYRPWSEFGVKRFDTKEMMKRLEIYLESVMEQVSV